MEFLDHHLQLLTKQGESYLKYTGDFLKKLKATKEIPKGTILVTADVVGLCPSIPLDRNLKVLRKQYNKFKDKMFPIEDIKMADFVLKNCLFQFDSKFYQQISGMAVGNKHVLSYACIVLHYIETEFLKTQAIKLWLWKRIINNILFIWADSEENLNKFLNDHNEFHCKFTYEKSKQKIDFLDLVMKITYGKIVSDFYCKSTDSHQYLHYDSCHVKLIKRSIVFNPTLQLKRICSRKSELDFHLTGLEVTGLAEKGYLE